MGFRGTAQTLTERVAYIEELIRRLYTRGVAPIVPEAAAGAGPWAATRIVAASDSLHPENADYICSGTDDQDIINQAILDLPDRGGRVLLLEGTFAITDSIMMRRWEMTLEGQGPGIDDRNWTGGATRLFIPDGTNAMFPVISTGIRSSTPPRPEGDWTGYATYLEPPYFPNNEGTSLSMRMGTVIRNLCIDGNAFNQTISTTAFNHGIQCINTSGIIENVAILEISGCGIVAFAELSESAPIIINKCRIQTPFIHGIVSGTDTIITNCAFEECGGDAFFDDIFGDPAGAAIVLAEYTSDAIVKGNAIRNVNGHGIWSLVNYDCVIADNLIDGFGYDETTALDYAGIICEGGGNASSPANASYGVQITGNVVWNGNTTGIHVKGTGTGDKIGEVNIVGNYLNDNGGPGIRLTDAHYCGVKDNILVSNAYINYFGYDSPALYSGIQVEGDSYENSIMGNIVRKLHNVGDTDYLQDYGITLDASTHDNWLVLNDLRNSGTTGSYSDAGTANDNTSSGNLV